MCVASARFSAPPGSPSNRKNILCKLEPIGERHVPDDPCHNTPVSTERTSGEGGGESDLPAPQGLHFEQRGNRFAIVRRWRRPAFLVLAFFCLGWNILFVIWFVLAFREGTPVFYKLISLFQAVAGIGITYITMAGLLNKTKISIDPQTLTVRHGPFPWPGNCEVNSAEVERVDCRERVIQGRHGGRRIIVGYRYSVFVHTRDGRDVKLVSHLIHRDQAQFIKGHLERQLRLGKPSVG